MLLSLKTGNTFNRWMGTLTLPDGSSKCINLTTATEKALTKRKLQWTKFVKRVIELPPSDYVTKLLGIYIDISHLYVVHEHLICETLQDYLENYRKDQAVKVCNYSSSKMLPYVTSYLNGMKFIHSYGFVHPGMSTRKILVTENGVCKIYAFCLPEDARNAVITLMSTKACSLNELAPEALFRNEYSEASDVWSASIIIWLTLIDDLPPFSVDDMSSFNVRNDFEMTEENQRLRRNLLNSWNRDDSMRSTLDDLKQCFETGLTNKTSTLNETAACGLNYEMEGYVPMTRAADLEL